MDDYEQRVLEFARATGIEGCSAALLTEALTHRSYLGEDPDARSYERLEFLGDSIIGAVIAEYLHATYPERREGELAKAKAVAVSEPVLARAAREWSVAGLIRMSPGEETASGRERSSILADVFEAVVGAVHLDLGFDAARELVLDSVLPVIEDADVSALPVDYKSLLQEHAQGMYRQTPEYRVLSESGADHDKTFTVEASVGGTPLGVGSGKSKKQAEQAAARQALTRLTAEEEVTDE